MSEWVGDTQARLEAGESLIFIEAAHIKARNLVTDEIDYLGFSQGQETFALTIEGEARTYLPLGSSLSIQTPTVEAGLTVAGGRVEIAGLNEQVSQLRHAYDLGRAEIDMHTLAWTPGMQFSGYRLNGKGSLDGDPLNFDDTSGSLSLVTLPQHQRGTRSFDLYLDEDRDPIFRYVQNVEGDVWQ